MISGVIDPTKMTPREVDAYLESRPEGGDKSSQPVKNGEEIGIYIYLF